jgi:prephenate dehydratase
MKIAFLGPEGSYSHLAGQAFLKEEAPKGERKINDWDECVPFRNFVDVFSAVANGRVDSAVVPISNSLQGGVLQNLDLLQSHEDLYAVKELVIRIDHRLAYKAGTKLSDIGRVYSHRQALDQCLGFLTKNLPFASFRETESTAFGLSRAMEDPSGKSVAIVGAHTENLRSGFVIGKSSIADEPNNFTQFLLIKKGEDKLPKGGEKIFFSLVGPHRPGGLLGLLRVIERYGINMTKIESRPVKDRPGDYRFFIEADCSIGSMQVRDMLSAIKKQTLECKLLGAYSKNQ